MNYTRAAWRLLRCLAQVLWGVLLCGLVFPHLTPQARTRQIALFSERILRALGVHLRVHGVVQPGPVMLVSNHISWLDILAINSVHTARFVSKADIRRWPLLGWIVACGGTLFIARERKRDAMRVVHQVAAALQQGDVIAVFPEGTTSDGRGMLPFHANLLQAAVVTQSPVQGVALRYEDAHADISLAAPYVGDITLMQSLWSVACAQGLTVRVNLLQPHTVHEQDRRGVSELLRAQIAMALALTPL